MITHSPNHQDKSEMSVEEKLRALFRLQTVDSQIDEIQKLRGELPMEVQDLEDDIAGLETRISKHQDEIEDLSGQVSGKNVHIKELEAKKKQFIEQQKNIRNNREYDSLNKEIEYKDLEAELDKKHIREFKVRVGEKEALMKDAMEQLYERQEDLKAKLGDLDRINSDTQDKEQGLAEKAEKLMPEIPERLLTAYKRIRNNARNRLGVVAVERDACGGCFAKIPPQRQMEIRARRKIIVCEYCGRILVDNEIDE